MSYDNPQMFSYSYGIHDFGAAADEVLSLKGPTGKTGRLVDIQVSATEIFTTGGDILIGTAADPNAYAELAIGTLADTDTITAQETSGAIIDETIPADTQVEVTFNQTGGTPTGQGFVHIFIEWY